jgi:hypothetical protein
MITIKAEQEHYCLVTDDGRWTVVERRAGKYFPLGDCSRPGVALDEPGATGLFREEQCCSEPTGRRVLADVATQWRYLAEHVR